MVKPDIISLTLFAAKNVNICALECSALKKTNYVLYDNHLNAHWAPRFEKGTFTLAAANTSQSVLCSWIILAGKHTAMHVRGGYNVAVDAAT